MKDRIAHIMRAKNLTATQFADQLQVQRSGISHLLSGRNKPSIDFIMKLKETFPEYSLDWLIMGKGAITVSDSAVYKKKNLDSSQNDEQTELTQRAVTNQMMFEYPDNQVDEDNRKAIVDEVQMSDVTEKQTDKKGIKKVLLVYTDNTFDEIIPNS